LRLIRTTDAAQAAHAAADEIAIVCRAAVAARDVAIVAVSGGETPWLMLEHWRRMALPWERIHVAQVDERIAPRDDPRRNLTRLAQILVTEGPLPGANLLAMPVEADDLPHAAARYQRQLEQVAGCPVTFDVVQLGLGADGHTASLVPGDAALDVVDRDVAVTGDYQGLRRMTLTYPALNRARRRLWLVTGAAKAARIAELVSGESADSAPGVRVCRADSTLVADREALALSPATVARPRGS
jgi:6-phosphogluconolactonase